MLVDGYTVNLGSWHTIQVVSDKHLYQPETGRTLFFDRYPIKGTKINCDGTVFDYNNRDNNAKEISLEEQYSDYSYHDQYFQIVVKENRENFTTCISGREWYHHDHQRPRFHWNSGQDQLETILSSDYVLYPDPRQQRAARLILEDLESFFVSPDRNYLISKSGIVYRADDFSTRAFLGDDIENIIFGKDYFLAQFKGAPRYQLFNSNFEQVQGGFCSSDGHCMSEVDARDVSTAFDHGKVVQVRQYGDQVEVFEFELKEVAQPIDYYVRESEENPADDEYKRQTLQIQNDQGNALYFRNHEQYGIEGINFWNSTSNKQTSIYFDYPVYYSERQQAIYTVLKSGVLVRFTMESLRSGNYHEVLVPFGQIDSNSFTKESVTYEEEKILIRLKDRQIQYDLFSGKTSILKR
ncbi:hypothetical protein [Algicola sagamiensis]|uniref:hypothetical protein n=1 Tax=Algicola sagamiensis TaxID=163869 RepID=UPI000377036B|nr:hypothetical protein [Algicola sagamiensis]